MESGHRSNIGILTALLREPAFRDRFVSHFVEGILDAWFPVFPFHDEFMLVLQELGELSEHIRGQCSEAHLLCAIDGEALQGPDDNVVVTDPGNRDLLDGYEVLECVEELLLRIVFLLFLLFLFLGSRRLRAKGPVDDKNPSTNPRKGLFSRHHRR